MQSNTIFIGSAHAAFHACFFPFMAIIPLKLIFVIFVKHLTERFGAFVCLGLLGVLGEDFGNLLLQLLLIGRQFSFPARVIFVVFVPGEDRKGFVPVINVAQSFGCLWYAVDIKFFSGRMNSVRIPPAVPKILYAAVSVRQFLMFFPFFLCHISHLSVKMGIKNTPMQVQRFCGIIIMWGDYTVALQPV